MRPLVPPALLRVSVCPILRSRDCNAASSAMWASSTPSSSHGGTMALHTPLTILVIDDERSFVRVLATLLRRDGYTVDTADNGELALALIEKRPYDVILYDIQMPARTVPTFSDIV